VADQMTPFLVVPLTLAVNCFVTPEYSVAVAGDMETVMRVGLTANARVEQRIKASNEAMRFIGSSDSGNSSVEIVLLLDLVTHCSGQASG